MSAGPMPGDDLATDGSTADTEAGGSVASAETIAEPVHARARTRTAAGRTPRTVEPEGPRPPFLPGELLDDYIVGEVLGEGGMGIVLAARDPDLDRPVAIKVLRRGVFGPHGLAHARARLLREAQAMARLSHPNVITVYRVGSVGEQLFVAMELVEGGTLRHWLAGPRSHGEIREAFLAAGRGLAAAHAAGLVHRDFKPDNVLVGRDGRVRVTDFGLVASAGAPDPSGAGEPGAHGDGGDGAARRGSASAPPLTNTGAVLGTPVYMAPEQHAGEAVDARADQFAFCVSLYEALYRERPFAGATYAALVEDVMAGRVHQPASDVVPPRLRALVLRGMARDPDRRFPSMDVLLDELARSVDGGDGARRELAGPPPADPALRERIAHLGARLDDAHAAERLGELERGLAEVAAIAEAVDATGHASLVARHRFVLGTLQERTTRLDEAVGSFRRAAAEAARAGDPILEARALTQLLFTVGSRRGETDRIEDLELAAASAVARAGTAPEAVWFETVVAGLAYDRARYADARAHYERALERWRTSLAGDPAHYRLGGALHANFGALLATTGEPGAARAHYERAREIFTGALGPDHPAVGDLELNAGILEAHLGDHARSHAHHERALELYRRAYGEHHERVAVALGNVGDALIHLGRPAPAFEALEAALAIRRALYPADHLEVASSLCTLGIAEVRNGRADAGGPRIEEALAIRNAKLAADHPDIAAAHGFLGIALEVNDQLDDAVTEYETAVRIYTEHGLARELAMQEHNLGLLWGRRGDLPRARVHLERADAAWQGVDPAGAQAGNTRFVFGQVLWDLGERPRALELIRGLRAPGRDAVESWLAERGG